MWLLSVHVRSLSVLTPPHCSLLSAPTAQAATELRELSCEHVLAAILAFHHLPNHSVGSDLTHAMRRYSMEPHLTFLEPCFNENRDQFVKTGSGQTWPRKSREIKGVYLLQVNLTARNGKGALRVLISLATGLRGRFHSRGCQCFWLAASAHCIVYVTIRAAPWQAQRMICQRWRGRTFSDLCSAATAGAITPAAAALGDRSETGQAGPTGVTLDTLRLCSRVSTLGRR